MKNPNRNKQRRAQRREDALMRQAAYDALSPAKKLAGLDLMFGPGLGAKKERTLLGGKKA